MCTDNHEKCRCSDSMNEGEVAELQAKLTKAEVAGFSVSAKLEVAEQKLAKAERERDEALIEWDSWQKASQVEYEENAPLRAQLAEWKARAEQAEAAALTLAAERDDAHQRIQKIEAPLQHIQGTLTDAGYAPELDTISATVEYAIDSLRSQLAEVARERDTAREENEKLRERVAELETHDAHMHRLRDLVWDLERVAMPWTNVDEDNKSAPISTDLLRQIFAEMHRGWDGEDQC